MKVNVRHRRILAERSRKVCYNYQGGNNDETSKAFKT